MAVKKSAAKAGAKAGKAAVSARTNPYLQRLLEDEQLREQLKSVYGSARNAYDRLSNGRAPGAVLLEDRKLHKDLSDTAVGLREAAVALREGAQRPKRRAGRVVLLVLVGAGVALGVSEGLRQKVLDALFGKEEQFDYTPTTATTPPPPPPPPPAPPAPSSPPSAAGSDTTSST